MTRPGTRGLLDKARHRGLLDKVRHRGLLDKARHRGLLDEARHRGQLDEARHRGLLDKARHRGLLDVARKLLDGGRDLFDNFILLAGAQHHSSPLGQYVSLWSLFLAMPEMSMSHPELP